MEEQPNASFENKTEHQDLVECLTEMVERAVLPKYSRFQDQCIYRVPHRIRQSNPEAYASHVVSIGPFHNPFWPGGDHRLKPMEDLKLQYLESFLEWSQLRAGECVSKLKEWEADIRHCYAEPIEHSSVDFSRMVLIDAGFIIEHFLLCSTGWDPLLVKQGLLVDVRRDMRLLENQLPFFVLRGLYGLAIARRMAADHNVWPDSFVSVTFKYFHYFNKLEIPHEGVDVLHFTDLLRTFMLVPSIQDELSEGEGDGVTHLYSASQLLEAGIDFKVNRSKCLLDFKFHKGVLEMPCLMVDDSTEMNLRNIIAFEQCHHPFSSYVVEYIGLLDFLINVEKDVSILVDRKIIDNIIGDADSVAKLFNNICKHTVV